MKKLLIALAAGAAAIGLRAGVAIGGAGFDKNDASPLTWTEAGGFASGYWTVPEGSTKTWTAGTVSSYSLSSGHPEGYNDDGKTDGCGYMAIKTSGAPIYQNVKESGKQKIGEGFYFDGLVQFTTFDEMPTIADDAKIAIFPMNNDPENDEAGASYYVYARGTDGNGYAWKTTTPADDNWHRVTVKMIANVSTTKEANDVGFVVFIDETALNCLDAKAVFASTTLSPAVDKWYQYGQLFGSLKGTNEDGMITGVAYDGQGNIDEVGFTDAAPWADAADDQFFTVTWGETIAKVEINGVEYTKPIIMDGTVETYTYQAFAKDGYVSMTEAVAFDPQPTNGDDMPIPALPAAGAYVTIGDVTKAYATVADAIVAAKSASAATIKLNAPVADGIVVENTVVDGMITIDLAGKTVTQGTDALAAIYVKQGNATVIDSIGGGIVAAAGDLPTAVDVAYDEVSGDALGAVTLVAGQYDGAVMAGTIAAAATAKFNVADNGDGTEAGCYLTAPTDYKWAIVEDYYVLDVAAVAKIGTTKYASLAAAIAAAQDIDGAIVEIVDDCAVDAQIKIEKGNFTISNNCDVTCADLAGKGDYSFLINGATVTFTGSGSWTKVNGSGSMVQAGATAAATVIINDGEYIGGDETWTSHPTASAPSNLFTTKHGSITVNGGTFKNWRYDQARCVRGEGGTEKPVTVTINGGDFTVRADRIGLTPSNPTTDRLIPVDNKNGAVNTTVTIGDAAKFTCHADNAKYMSAFCGAGYKLKLNSEDPARYVRTAIVYATYTVVADAGVESYVVSNGAEQVAADARFDIDDAVALTVYPTLKADYDLDDTSILTAQLTEEKEYAFNIVTKAAAQPLPPEEPIVKPDDKTIDDFVAEVNANKAKYLAAPYGETTKAYLDLFEAVPNGDNSGVTMELTTTAKEELEALADTAAATALDGDTLTIAEPVAGFYYSLNEGATLEGMKTLEANANKTVGDGAITFTPDKTGNAGFWKVLVTTKAVTPDVVD